MHLPLIVIDKMLSSRLFPEYYGAAFLTCSARFVLNEHFAECSFSCSSSALVKWSTGS